MSGAVSNMSEQEISTVSIALTVTKRQNQRCMGAAVHRRRNRSGDDDMIQYIIELYDFMDNEQFSNLDSFLVQMGSCILYVSEEYEDVFKGDAKKINNLCEGKDIEKIYSKKSLFTKKGGAEAIAKLCAVQTHFTNVAETERPLGYTCIDVLVSSLRLLDNSSSSGEGNGHIGKYDLRLGSLDNFMKLDSAAADAVNLLPKPDHPSQFGSIYGVLNRCKTKMGSRLLERWLRQPLIDTDAINARLDIVEILKLSTSARNQLYDGPLKGIPDLDLVVAKMQKKKAGLSEVFKLYQFTNNLPKILVVLHELLDSCTKTPDEGVDGRIDADTDMDTETAGSKIMNLSIEKKANIAQTLRTRFIEPFEGMSAKFGLYQQLVEHVLDMDQLPDLVVRPSHDEDLRELHDEQTDLVNQAEKLVKEARNTFASFATVALDISQKDGLSFRTTRGDDERELRENNNKVRIISILKNGLFFTTPQMERLADRYKDIDVEYKAKASGLVDKALATATTYLPVAEAAAGVVAEIDVLSSFAMAAAMAPNDYVRPTLLPRGEGVLRFEGARHPCVELMEDVNFIANNYSLERGQSNFQLITGPNMGGKSTYIRGIGSIAVMAQVGSFVPCDSAELSVIDYVLARVGAGDAVQKGVSTFMAEMLEASVILETATRDSLIIIDELGRGTSTFDGFGIAWAISEYLVTKVDCMCLFATHFHELTALAAQHSSVVNKHVSAYVTKASDKRKLIDNDSAGTAAETYGTSQGGEVVMLYTVQDGPCTQSFGIHVANTARFPKEVIAEAKRKAAELEGNGIVVHDDIAATAATEKRQRIMAAMHTFASRSEASFVESATNNTLRSEMQEQFPISV